jgi:hypothetical protein
MTKTAAFTLAAILVSATASMAAPVHHRLSAQERAAQAERARDARASYAQDYQQNAAAQHYYEPDDNGSMWSYYQGYSSR